MGRNCVIDKRELESSLTEERRARLSYYPNLLDYLHP
jgi:hypothetical protein